MIDLSYYAGHYMPACNRDYVATGFTIFLVIYVISSMIIE